MNEVLKQRMLDGLKVIIKRNLERLLKQEQALLSERADVCAEEIFKKMVGGIDYFYEQGKIDKGKEIKSKQLESS